MTDNGKKYLINVGDEAEMWTSDMYAEKGDKLFSSFSDAQVFEVEEAADFDEDPTDHQYIINVGDESEVWDGDMVKEKGAKLKEAYPDVKIQRVSYKDYWGEQATANRERRAELMKPDAERNARLAELGYYDDMTGEANAYTQSEDGVPQFGPSIGLKPLSSVMSQSPVTGLTMYADPKVAEFFTDDTYADRQAEIARLDAEYEENPSVIAEREWRAKVAKEQAEYNSTLEARIRKDAEADGMGDAQRRQYKKMAPMLGMGNPMLTAQYSAMYADAELPNEQSANYASALNMMEKIKELEKVAEKGFGDATLDVAREKFDSWMQPALADYNKIGDILTKLSEKLKEQGLNLEEENLSEEVFDKYLSNDEKALIQAFFQYNSALQNAQADMSGWYKGGKIFAESIPFMLEFLATGGLYKAAGSAATKGMAGALKRWVLKAAKGTAQRTIRKGAALMLKNGIYALAGTAARTVVAPNTYTRMAEKSIEIEDGELHRVKNSFVGFFDSYVENLSEVSGGLIGKALGAPFRGVSLLGKTAKGASLASRLGQTSFAQWGKMLGNTKTAKALTGLYKSVMPNMKQLGFHGLPEEIGEEYIGNAIRAITIDPNALKDMHEDGNFGAMLIGFAPMTLLGVGGGAATLAAVNVQAAKYGEYMRNMLGSHYNGEQVDHMMGKILGAENSQQMQDAIDPMIEAIKKAQSAGKLSQKQAEAEIKSIYDYSEFVAKNKVLMFAKQTRDTELADEKKAQMQAEYGKYWQESPEGTQTVQTATLNDGRTVFVTSAPAADGKIAIVDANTKKIGFANVSDIATEEVDGKTQQKSQTYTMDAYINGEIANERKTSEQSRMDDERNAQIESLKSGIANGTKINLGTEGAPVEVIATGKTSKAGVEAVASTGETMTIGWEQVADALGKPIIVKTNQQIVDEQAAEIVRMAAERRAKRQPKDETTQVAEQTSEEISNAVAQEEKHIPMLPDGTVNESAFWQQNPEEYAKWNDEQNQDGGADTREQIEAELSELQAMLKEQQKAQQTSNPSARKEAKLRAGVIMRRMMRLNSLALEYEIEEKRRIWENVIGARIIHITTPEELARYGGEEAVAASHTGARVRGFYNEGQAYVYIPGLNDASEYDEVFIHEVLGHYGLRQMLGKDFDWVLQNVWEMMSEESRQRFMNYPGVKGIKDQAKKQLAAADEYIAHIAERMSAEEISGKAVSAEEKSIWRRIIDMIKGWFVKKGVDESVMTDDAIRSLIRQSYAYLAERKGENLAPIKEEGRGSALSAVEQEYETLAQDLTAEEIKAVATNEFNAAQEAYDALAASAPKVEAGELAKDFIARKKAYNEQLAEAKAALDARQALMDEIARIDAANAPVLTDAEVLEQEGLGVDTRNDDVRMSVRYVPTEKQREMIIGSIMNVTGRTREEAERWLASETSLAAMINEDLQYLDYVADPKYKAIKDNSDYPQGTVDFNNICRKRLPFTRMFTRLQRRFPNRVFTAEELADIRTIMSKDDLMVACGLCYVEDRRQMVGEVAQSFIDGLQEQFKTYANNPTKKKNAKKFNELIAGDTYVPQVYDLTTQEGLDKLYNEHRGIWEAFQAFNNARGQQSQNLLQGYAEYKREILSWSDKKVKSVNDNGGLRIFSYSDFEAHHLIDVVQIIIDCAAKGVKIQGYTKVPEFARAVANTGIKLNRSLIPLGDTGLVDGQLAFDPVEGIDINDPNFLESNDNVGNILIGINDEQIRIAMADPRIHYIIPYHARQKENIRQKLNVGAWTNYISTQNERNISDGKRVKDNINIYTDILTGDVTTDRQFVEKYLQLCKEQGRIPKFDQFLEKDAEGNYLYTPGYYKFLVDFKLFDENGNILPQQPVVAEFDDAFNMQILENYAKDERESTGEQMNETYDKIVDALGLDESAAEGEDVKFSARTDEQREALFDKAKAQFGLTNNFKVAGYMLPDGSLLDFSEANDGGDPNQRTLDHREIEGIIMDEGREYDSRWMYLADFMNEGAIRLLPEYAGINIMKAPTKKQRQRLFDFIYKYNGEVILEIADERLNNVAYVEYGRRTSPARIFRDIDGYFNEGIVPQQDVRFSVFEPHNATIDEIDGLFREYNMDESLVPLYDKVSALAHTMDLKIRFDYPWSAAAGSTFGDKVKFNTEFFNSLAYMPQDKAHALLHEMIHATTNYAIAARNTGALTEGMKEAVSQLESIYGEIVNDRSFDGTYGAKSIYEMVAELSNPEFRSLLKEKNLFQRILDAIKRLLGIEVGENALDNLSATLDYMLDNYDGRVFGAVVNQYQKHQEYTRFSARQDYTPEELAVLNEYFPGYRQMDTEKPVVTEADIDEGDIRYSVVTDPALLERLDSEPTIKVYRAMQLIDGKLYPPMSAKVDGKMREPVELGKWEQAEERPDLADEKGYFKLDKGNKTSLKARYNPYFHTSPTPLNDQFSSAQTRPELVTVEVEVPESELTSGYKAEKAKDSVGQMEWKAGVVQGKLSGTRTVILSRWDKPIRIVPDSEVADKIVEMFEGKDIIMPSNVVTPSLRAELEKRGVPFVETDNQGKKLQFTRKNYQDIPQSWFDSVEQAQKATTLNGVDEITDRHFKDYAGSVILPSPSKALAEKILSGDKKVLIKKGIFAKNEVFHNFTPEQSRKILNEALYTPNRYGQSQPISRPLNWVAIKTGDKNAIIVLEVNETKDYLEIVSWHTLDARNLKRIERQAKREGGEILILDSEESLAASLSALPSDLSSDSKDSDNIENNNTEENISFDVNTNPTEAQKKAGNYKMGHLRLDGYNITIENPKGSVRRGTDSKGNEWENTLNNDYGYIRGTEGVDGDHIDVYLSDNPAEGNVFVIDQVNPETREFDEHKVMYGFNSMDEAREAYLANFSEGWNGLGTITEVTKDEFRKWIDSSHRKTKPFSEYKSVKAEGAQSEGYEEEDITYSVPSTPTDEIVAEGMKFSIQDFARLAGNIFQDMPESFRKEAIEETFKRGWDMQSAIFQIPARLAEKENWDEADKELAKVIREKVQDAMDESGVVMSRPLTTKEALWMLYLSTEANGDSILDAAKRSIVAHNLGFDSRSMALKKAADDIIRYSVVRNRQIDAATDMYNYEANLWTSRLAESWLDMNQSVIALQNALADASGKPIESWEDVVLALNQLSSKSYTDKKKYMRDFLKPLWDAVMDIVRNTDFKIEDIERYMMLKHGLERNEKFAKRDAKQFYKEMFDKVADRMKNTSHAEQVVALSEAKKRIADIDNEIATAKGKKLKDLQEARERAVVEKEIAELVLRGDEKQNEQDLQDYYDNIDNELNQKYWEFREKDYGGLTSMFQEKLHDVKRKDYKTEEAYQKALLASVKPKYDKVADMENAAKDEVIDFEEAVPSYYDLWKKINAATKEVLRHQHASGVITTEQYDAVRNMFKYYVPLRGFADNTAEDMYSYYMDNSAGGFAKPIIAAKGRKTRAESPLGWIGTMAESAIQQDNKNEAKMKLYYALMNRPDTGVLSLSEMWYEFSHKDPATGKKVFVPAYPPATGKALSADELRQHMDAWEDSMKAKQAIGEAYRREQGVNLGGSVIFQDKAQDAEHIIRVKVAGKDYTILVNGNPRAAQAVNGILNPESNVGPVMQWYGELRRGMSALMTSFSPLFWVSNYQRDLLSSFMRTSESEGWGQAFRYLGNRWQAWRVAKYVYAYDNGTMGDSYYENLYKEFAENGGITGYTSLTTNKEYEKLLEDYAKHVDQKALNWIKNVWEKFMGFGEAIEQVSRFAAYITARESGKSIEDSVAAAKEVSVNFNRKGSAAPISLEELDKLRDKNGKPLNAPRKALAIVLSAMPKGMKELYFFFNASIQALSSSAKLAKKSPGKAMAWAGMYMGLSVGLAFLNYLLAGDDDDNDYLDLPDYLRHSTALVKISDEYYVKWSIPQEMRPFYATADILISKAMGKMPHKNVGKEVFLAMAEWLPVNPFGTEDPILALVPDVGAPLAEIKANQNSFGGKIYNDMTYRSEEVVENIPAYRKGTSKTGKIYVDMAELLNDISGGDEVKKGAININPAIVEHLVEGYGGGIYDFAKMLVSLPALMTSDEPLEVRDIPFVNKVILSTDETNMYSHTNEAFMYYSGVSDNAQRIEKEYFTSDDPARAEAYRREDDWRIHLLYKQYEEDFKDFRKQLDEAVDETEISLLREQQNAVREQLLNDIANGVQPDPLFEAKIDMDRKFDELSTLRKAVAEAAKKEDAEAAEQAQKDLEQFVESEDFKRYAELRPYVKAYEKLRKATKEAGSAETRQELEEATASAKEVLDEKLKEF